MISSMFIISLMRQSGHSNSQHRIVIPRGGKKVSGTKSQCKYSVCFSNRQHPLFSTPMASFTFVLFNPRACPGSPALASVISVIRLTSCSYSLGCQILSHSYCHTKEHGLAVQIPKFTVSFPLMSLWFGGVLRTPVFAAHKQRHFLLPETLWGSLQKGQRIALTHSWRSV